MEKQVQNQQDKMVNYVIVFVMFIVIATITTLTMTGVLHFNG